MMENLNFLGHSNLLTTVIYMDLCRNEAYAEAIGT